MAESDVAIAQTEISPVDNQTLETTPPSETAPVAAEPKLTEAELEKEVKETQGEEEAEVASEGAATGEEIGQENQDLKRKLEVQEDVERQLEGTGNGEDGNEREEEREGSEAKRQKTETEEAQKLGEAREEERPLTENGEHDNNDFSGQTAEGDVKKDDLDADETERIDDSSETSRTIEVPNHRVLVFYVAGRSVTV